MRIILHEKKLLLRYVGIVTKYYFEPVKPKLDIKSRVRNTGRHVCAQHVYYVIIYK